MKVRFTHWVKAYFVNFSPSSLYSKELQVFSRNSYTDSGLIETIDMIQRNTKLEIIVENNFNEKMLDELYNNPNIVL